VVSLTELEEVFMKRRLISMGLRHSRTSDQERLNYGFINVIDLPIRTYSMLPDRPIAGFMKFGKRMPVSEVPEYN
jgi:hypothetical protein